MVKTLTTVIAGLFRPAKAPVSSRAGINPLTRVRAGGLTLDPRRGR